MTDTASGLDERLSGFVRRCDQLLALEPLKALPGPLLKQATRVFWLYHLLLAAVMTINVRVPIVSDPVIFVSGVPLMICWGLYAAHFLLVYMPAHMFADLYSYFRRKGFEPGGAMTASVLLLVVVMAASIFEFWIS
jgi:hypothetical protein